MWRLSWLNNAILLQSNLSTADALTLFENKLGGYCPNDHDDAAQLAAALEFMPLAIVQAAAYISQRAPRYSVRKYLQDFQKSDRKRTTLLTYEGELVRRDWEAKNSIITTWQISFDYIREVRRSAADLLSLMSFFDRQGIPEVLLRSRNEQRNLRQVQKESSNVNYDDEDGGQSHYDKDDTSESSVDDGFEDDVMALRNYSFISIDRDGTTFEMHRLVQLATWSWLEAHGQIEKWKKQSIRNLDTELPTGEYENWVICQALFPHAQSVAAQQPEEQDSLRDWASILYKAAWYAWKMGNGVEAEKMSVQAMKVRKRILGQEHNDTLYSMAMVGLAYDIKGRWNVAAELQVQVMEISKKKRGGDHLDTLTSMNNLALTLQKQGRWDAAEELGVQVVEARKKKLGIDHPDTLTSMANLALTYNDQRRLDAAEELGVQVVETRKKKLGIDHPDTLTSMANLALTYYNLGRWDAAEELGVQVVETRKKKLGIDHPATLTSMANLALTYNDQGRLDAAEELGVQVVETRKKKLGIDHPDTLTSMANLALTYYDLGRLDAAEELEVQVLETSKKKFGTDHPETLTRMHNLAFTLKTTGREIEAVRLMEECIQSRKRVIGNDHPRTLLSYTALASWKAEQEGVILPV